MDNIKFIDHRVYFIDTIEQYKSIQKQKVYNENGVNFPVLYPLMVHKDLIIANDYNPNHVNKEKMELLRVSIVENGFAFGIVSILDEEISKFVIIDGDHRNQITDKKWLDLTYKPLIILNHKMEKRLAATVQFNKARGVHKIDLNAELVKKMVELGMEDSDICKQLGIDADEFLRLKRNVKIADIYKDLNYSNSWE